MSTNTTERENPLLQIDTSFRTYLNAYTRSYQNHIVDGVLDYDFVREIEKNFRCPLRQT